MTLFDLVVRAQRVVTPVGERAAAVCVRGGRIVAVESFDAAVAAAHVVELSDREVLLPGLVDSHVHVNEPGRTEWEGFASATRAATAGGVTTIVDMPLNSIPATVNADALAVKQAAARDRVYTDVGFWGGAVPGNGAELLDLHAAGVFGFKAFTIDSGVAEFGHLDRDGLADACRRLAELGALLIVHAEDAEVIANAPAPSGRRYRDFLASRPAEAETTAIASLLELAERFGTRVHVLHLSSADALPRLANAKANGVAVTVETCPHYLTFAAEDIPDGATEFKCCPPIRAAENRERLWAGLIDGVIDLVVSDHSPCTAELKRADTGDFGAAWGGIAGLQLGLAAVWTGARQRGATLADVARWLADNPADLVGLQQKGRIEPGADADLCAVDPERAFVVNAGTLQHRNPVSAYHGSRLTGVVTATWLRGVRVRADRPTGELLRRNGV